MRRTLFGKAPEVELPSAARASVREVLFFDVRDHEANSDFTLAERRVAGWTFAPWLLLAGHLVVTAALIFQDRPSGDWKSLAAAMAPLGLSLLTDLIAGLIMLAWRRLQLAPHTVTRVMCVYIGITGLLWMLSTAGVRNLNRTNAYLNNLFRLGLIWFSHEEVEPSRYQVVEVQPEVQDAMAKAGRAPKTVRRSIHLTPFGEDFCQTCLPD